MYRISVHRTNENYRCSIRLFGKKDRQYLYCAIVPRRAEKQQGKVLRSGCIINEKNKSLAFPFLLPFFPTIVKVFGRAGDKHISMFEYWYGICNAPESYNMNFEYRSGFVHTTCILKHTQTHDDTNRTQPNLRTFVIFVQCFFLSLVCCFVFGVSFSHPSLNTQFHLCRVVIRHYNIRMHFFHSLCSIWLRNRCIAFAGWFRWNCE